MTSNVNDLMVARFGSGNLQDSIYAWLAGYQQERVVDPDGRGPTATSLVATLAAITDASASNRYRVRVVGDVNETAQVVGKSHVDVVSEGLSIITVTSTTGGPGTAAASFTDVVDSVWRNIRVVRAGTLTGVGNSNTDALYVSNSAAPTVAAPHAQFVHCEFINSIVDGGSVVHCTGVNLLDYAAPTFQDCLIKGGDVTYGYGLLVNDYANPLVVGGRVVGGDGTNAHALLATYAATGKYIGARIDGSAAGGTAAHGVLTLRASKPELIGCIFTANKAGSYAICSQSNSAPRISGGLAIGAAIQTNDFVVALQGNSAPVITNLHIKPREVVVKFGYDDANDGRIQPSASHPYQLVSIDVDVLVQQAAAVTLAIGTTVAGTEVCSGIALDVPAATYPDVVIATAGRAVFAAGAYLYLTPSAAVADAAFDVYVTFAVAYGRNEALYIETKGAALISGCTLEVSGASNAAFVDTDAITSPQWAILGSRLIARRTASSYVAMQCAASMSNIPVHNCSFVGAAGSNCTSWLAAAATYGTNTRML